MDVNEVKALVAAEFPEADVTVSVEGGHYTVTVVSEQFDGVLPCWCLR